MNDDFVNLVFNVLNLSKGVISSQNPLDVAISVVMFIGAIGLV